MTTEELKGEIDALTRRVKHLEDTCLDKERLQITRPAKAISPGEFLIENKYSGEVHATFLLGYYAEHKLNMESFNIVDIEKLFRTARVPVPSNLNDKINKNIKKGFLTEALEKKDGKKAWTLTMTGDEEFNKLK